MDMPQNTHKEMHEDMKELEALLEKMIDHPLSGDEEDRLAQLLRTSPEARQLFWRVREMDGLLREHASHVSSEPKLNIRTRRRRSAWLVPMLASAAGILALLTIIGLPKAKASPKPGPAMARITGSEETRWAKLSDNHMGELPAGTYELKEGVAQLSWRSGATVAVRGPSSFRLRSLEEIQLLEGQMGLHIPVVARGFVVETPDGKMIDHGDLGVSVEAGQTDAHLFQGEMDVLSHEGRIRLQEPGRIVLRSGECLKSEGAAVPEGFPIPQHERLLRELHGDFETPRRWGGKEPDVFNMWDGDQAKVVSSFGGIKPRTGNGMLQFLSSLGEEGPSKAVASQHIFWLDLRPYGHLMIRDALELELSAYFNRVKGNDTTDTRFALLAHAYAGEGIQAAEEIAEASQVLYTNDNEDDWEHLRLTFPVPGHATMLRIEVHAYENIKNDSVGGTIEFAGHFVDDLEARLVTKLTAD